MRRTDNNGQIAQNETCALIGKWTIAKTNEKGMAKTIIKQLKKTTYDVGNEIQNLTARGNYDGTQKTYKLTSSR